MKKLKIISILMVYVSISYAGVLVPGMVIRWGYEGSGYGNAANVVTIAGQTLTNAVSIATGSAHSLALRSNGTVVGWGFDYYGQASGCKAPGPNDANGLVEINGETLSNVTDIAAWENSSLALKSDGTLVGWGEVKIPAGLSNIVAITKGSLALKNNGTLTSWGNSKIPAGLSNVVAIAASGTYRSEVFALKSDGTVMKWNDWQGEPSIVSGLSNLVAIATGRGNKDGQHYLALKNDGTVFGWGINHNGQATGVESGTDSLVTSKGQVVSNIVAIAAGMGYSLGLKRNGTVTSWGKIGIHPLTVPEGLSNVVAIAAGADFCLAITTNRAVADKFRKK